MKNRIVDIYYFSGTGNTLLIVRALKNELNKNKYEVNLFKLEKSDPSKINLNHAIGIAFPVAHGSTYNFIWNFVKNLPDSNETEAFIVDTLAGFSGGVIGPMKKEFKKKGYKTVGAKEIIMPSNFSKKPMNEIKKQKLISKGQITARRFAHDLLFGYSKWIRVPVLSDFINKISSSKLLWNYMKNKATLQLDEYKCIKCGICFRLCPVDNIKMYEYPEFQDHCVFCLRCFNFCPENAIDFSKMQIAKYRSIPPNEIL